MEVGSAGWVEFPTSGSLRQQVTYNIKDRNAGLSIVRNDIIHARDCGKTRNPPPETNGGVWREMGSLGGLVNINLMGGT